MEDATAESALAAFSATINLIAEPIRHSLTHDYGKEMGRHAELLERTGVNIYFCDPQLETWHLRVLERPIQPVHGRVTAVPFVAQHC